MKFNKQILEAVKRGIKLAIDDFDFNNIKSNSFDIVNDDKYIEMKVKFNHLAQYYKVLSKEQLKELADLHYQYGFTYKIYNTTELKSIINYICDIDTKADLNWVDVSKITSFFSLFRNSEFIGNISEWNVSNVTQMQYAFSNSNFNGDISKWDVSNVTNMIGMFMHNERFDRDISNWDVSNVILMDFMFYDARSFKQDISNWKLHPSLGKSQLSTQLSNMFSRCPISKKHKPLKLQ